jgi:hypothetical protein
VRGDGQGAQIGHEPRDIVGLVGAERGAVPAALAAEHGQRGGALGGAGGAPLRDDLGGRPWEPGAGHQGIDDQAVTVLHHKMAHVAEPGLLAARLAPRGDLGGRPGAPRLR